MGEYMRVDSHEDNGLEEYLVDTAEEMIALGKTIGDSTTQGDVIAFDAGLGMGKTTLTKGIALALGITDPVTSPTYTMISEYEGRLPLFHMDLYRIKDQREIALLGIEEYFYMGGVSVVEWSSMVHDILPRHTLHITITLNGYDRRVVKLEKRD